MLILGISDVELYQINQSTILKCKILQFPTSTDSINAETNVMHTSENTVTKNALTAIVLYELSRLDTLPLATQSLIASELTAAIKTLRMSERHADAAFHESQSAYYSLQKRDAIDRGSHSANQVSYAIAAIMHCVHKAYSVDGLQNEIIASTIEWVKKTVANNGK